MEIQFLKFIPSKEHVNVNKLWKFCVLDFYTISKKKEAWFFINSVNLKEKKWILSEKVENVKLNGYIKTKTYKIKIDIHIKLFL